MGRRKSNYWHMHSTFRANAGDIDLFFIAGPEVSSVVDAIAEAQSEMGVTFVYDVDKEAFRQATAGMVDKYSAEYPGVAKLLALIEQIRAAQ